MFFEWPRYDTHLRKILGNPQDINVNLDILLFGNPELSDYSNNTIFSHVHTYRLDTKRFL